MKLPKKGAIVQNVSYGVGATGGIGIGRAANQYFPENKKTSGYVKLGLAAALIFGTAFIPSKDWMTTGAKGLAHGIAGEKALSGVADLLADTDVALVSESDSEGKQMLQAALGLKGVSCGCQNTTPQQGIVLPALNFPVSRSSSQQINMVETAPNEFSADSMLR